MADEADENPASRTAAGLAAALVLGVGIAVLLTVEEPIQGLQRMFLVCGIALVGCWTMLAMVTTDTGRATVRGLTMGVVLGLLPVGSIGLLVVMLG